MSQIKARSASLQTVRVGLVNTAIENPTPSLIGYGTPTSNGAADGTTLIDASGVANSGAADTYNGRHWVRLISGARAGEWARVVDDNGSGTLTFEGAGFTAQVSTSMQYELWLLPDTICVATGAGSTTTIADTVRAEADDFWIGWYAEAISGANVGELRRVTDSVSGTLTTDAFSNSWAAGDVILLRQYVEVADFTPNVSEPFLARPQARANWSEGDGAVAHQGQGPLTFSTWVVASGSVAAVNDFAATNPTAALLQASGLIEVKGKSSVIDTGAGAATTTSLPITTGKHENFTIGQMVIVQGNATFIVSKTDGGVNPDTLTVSPPLPIAPANAVAVVATRMYRKSTSGNDTLPCSIMWEQDGIRHTFFGCHGNVEFVDGSPCMFKFTLSYILYTRQLLSVAQLSLSTDPYTTNEPILEGDKIAYKLPPSSPGTNATRIDCGAMTASPDATTAVRKVSGRFSVNGVSGIQHTRERGGMSFDAFEYVTGTSLEHELEWQIRTPKTYAIVYNSHARTVAFRIPNGLLQEAPHIKSIDGMLGKRVNVLAENAGAVTDPTAGVQHLPDWSLHIA